MEGRELLINELNQLIYAMRQLDEMNETQAYEDLKEVVEAITKALKK